MKNSNPTQAQEVLEYMQLHGSITILESIYDLCITRLSSRIYELKKKGHKINAESVRVKKVNGKYTNVTRYTLI